MNPFQNANIAVASIEAKMASTGNMKYILTATDKKKYYFFQKVKGADCDVFQTFNNMGVKQGSVIAIGFTEEEKTFTNPKGETIKYTDRYIGSMREATGVPVQTPTQAQKAPQKANLSEPAYVSEAKDEKFWDKKAYKQCLWNYWLEHVKPANTENWKSLVWEVFNEIEKDAELRFSPKTFGTDEPLPEDLGEVDMNQIPF